MLPLDCLKHMLELRTNARLQRLALVDDRTAQVARSELAPFARSSRDVPVLSGSLRSLVHLGASRRSVLELVIATL